jgi:hypothetical protein
MEDRNTAALYLEMTDADATTYAAERVPQVLSTPGVHRATWWDNVHRDRADLPRALPEFSLLGVYEVERSFTPPRAPADVVSAHLFHRTPRPGQGSLSDLPTIGLSLVLVSPRHADGAQALRDWADFVHIRTIAETAVPGFRMITPYENVAGGEPRFLHFYEMDTDDPEAAFLSMPKLVMDRIGAPGTAFDGWAGHAELRIMYVNSFRRLGERASDPPRQLTN